MSAPTVLVVEDNRANLKLAELLLVSAGYQVLRAQDAEQGIDLAKTYRPDLVLMDIHLPGMDGLSATRMLKQDTATASIKVVALTGRAMQDDRHRARLAGCDAYIAKPIDSAAFLETVAKILTGRHQ